ncbi:MAG: FAD-dependent oxidoreductase [Gemmatimonadaceae bacterium]|nr:FAD-dependent oxidoreductase [Gemmatimonadaceae bacterium]
MASRSASRREFLRSTFAAAPVLWGVGHVPWHQSYDRTPVEEISADFVIIGGGLGGCSAALAAARRGLRVIMTEETAWIGGQLTAQAVPPDENRWIETIGGTRSYRELRSRIRDYYRTRRPLRAAARANPLLNPGNGWVSRLCCEPRVALAVLEEMLAPEVASGRLAVLTGHVPIDADVDGDRVRAVRVRRVEDGREVVLRAPYFADATELGDLLPLTRTEYVTGTESRRDTEEPHAKETAEPDNVQGFTFCFAMEHLAGEHHVIDRPVLYDEWRQLVLRAADGAPYHLVSFEDVDSRRIGFDPVARKGFWTYRRIVDRDLYEPGRYASDITIVNWAQNDYSFGALIDVDAATAARHRERAKQLSLSLLYWLQAEAPRPDGGVGWPGLRLRPDIVGTRDGMAMAPYIRESRRIRAEFTVREQHVTEEARRNATGASREPPTAMPFADSVGIGHYSMDLHLTTRGDRGQYGATLPFQIPLGALLPVRVENLLPACKNIGVTHLTNGCYRLHPIEWNVGESVGSLVAFAHARRTSPRGVRNTPGLLADFLAALEADGVPLAWPHPLPP